MPPAGPPRSTSPPRGVGIGLGTHRTVLPWSSYLACALVGQLTGPITSFTSSANQSDARSSAVMFRASRRGHRGMIAGGDEIRVAKAALPASLAQA
jgi:hypothetical protein